MRSDVDAAPYYQVLYVYYPDLGMGWGERQRKGWRVLLPKNRAYIERNDPPIMWGRLILNEGWRSIRSAPRDGTIVYAKSSEAGCNFIAFDQGEWATFYSAEDPPLSHDDVADYTHWQPLPSPLRHG